ncbi:MAG: low affinity iron permease family protein, partial [Myxococcales bacterium]|nr:low affinity iron permease family protein [Myxococcales bacterium]
FLMVFLIQNTQNRDMRTLHLKLDELLRGVEGARDSLIDLEALSDEELLRLEREFHELQKRGQGDADRLEAIRKEREDRRGSASDGRLGR